MVYKKLTEITNHLQKGNRQKTVFLLPLARQIRFIKQQFKLKTYTLPARQTHLHRMLAKSINGLKKP